MDCGYEDKCAHSNIQYVADLEALEEETMKYTKMDDQYHHAYTHVIGFSQEYRCMDCGIYFTKADNGEFEYLYAGESGDEWYRVEEHEFVDGVCSKCGYQQENEMPDENICEINFISPSGDCYVNGDYVANKESNHSDYIRFAVTSVPNSAYYRFAAKFDGEVIAEERTVVSGFFDIPSDKLVKSGILYLRVEAFDKNDELICEKAVSLNVVEAIVIIPSDLEGIVTCDEPLKIEWRKISTIEEYDVVVFVSEYSWKEDGAKEIKYDTDKITIRTSDTYVTLDERYTKKNTRLNVRIYPVDSNGERIGYVGNVSISADIDIYPADTDILEPKNNESVDPDSAMKVKIYMTQYAYLQYDLYNITEDWVVCDIAYVTDDRLYGLTPYRSYDEENNRVIAYGEIRAQDLKPDCQYCLKFKAFDGDNLRIPWIEKEVYFNTFSKRSEVKFINPLQNSSVDGNIALDLMWTSISDAAYYKYSAHWLDQENAFISNRKTNDTSATIPITQMRGGKDLQLWVGAFNSSDELLCEDTIQVHTTGADATIEFTSPRNGDTVPHDEVLAVNWTEVPKADHYEFSARYDDEETAFISHRKVARDEQHTDMDVALMKEGKVLHLWIAACDEYGNIQCEQLIQVHTTIPPCQHVDTTEVEVSAPTSLPAYTIIDGSYHEKRFEVAYQQRCVDCGEYIGEIEKRWEIISELHDIVDGICAKCGYQQTGEEPECPHEHTTEVEVSAPTHSPIYTSIDAEQHSKRYEVAYQMKCEDCGELVGEVTTRWVETQEAHEMSDGSCTRCGYSEQCQHPNITEEKSERTEYVKFDEGEHIVQKFVVTQNVCPDCGYASTPEEGMESAVEEAHLFLGNACAKCGYQKTAKPQVTGFTMSANEIYVNESISFTVYADNADQIMMYVDGQTYAGDIYPVKDGVAEFTRTFTSTGNHRKVQFKAGLSGNWGELCEAQYLTVLEEVLEKDEVVKVENDYKAETVVESLIEPEKQGLFAEYFQGDGYIAENKRYENRVSTIDFKWTNAKDRYYKYLKTTNAAGRELDRVRYMKTDGMLAMFHGQLVISEAGKYDLRWTASGGKVSYQLSGINTEFKRGATNRKNEHIIKGIEMKAGDKFTLMIDFYNKSNNSPSLKFEWRKDGGEWKTVPAENLKQGSRKVWVSTDIFDVSNQMKELDEKLKPENLTNQFIFELTMGVAGSTLNPVLNKLPPVGSTGRDVFDALALSGEEIYATVGDKIAGDFMREFQSKAFTNCYTILLENLTGVSDNSKRWKEFKNKYTTSSAQKQFTKKLQESPSIMCDLMLELKELNSGLYDRVCDQSIEALGGSESVLNEFSYQLTRERFDDYKDAASQMKSQYSQVKKTYNDLEKWRAKVEGFNGQGERMRSYMHLVWLQDGGEKAACIDERYQRVLGYGVDDLSIWNNGSNPVRPETFLSVMDGVPDRNLQELFKSEILGSNDIEIVLYKELLLDVFSRASKEITSALKAPISF